MLCSSGRAHFSGKRLQVEALRVVVVRPDRRWFRLALTERVAPDAIASSAEVIALQNLKAWERHLVHPGSQLHPRSGEFGEIWI